MKTFTLPGTDLVVPEVVLGLMRIADKTDDEIRTLVRTAADAGIDFVDLADVYGPTLHECEARYGAAMKLTSSDREKVTIQTKAGIVREPLSFDFSYEHLVESGVEEIVMTVRENRIDFGRNADVAQELERVAADPDVAHLPLLLEAAHGRDRLADDDLAPPELDVMGEVEVDHVGTEAPETLLDRRCDACRGEVEAVRQIGAVSPHLRDEDDLVSLPDERSP